MNRVPVILALTLLIFGVCSCDFFRSLAGRPGSAEIAAKRVRIERAEAYRDSVQQARLDSIALAERSAADSLHAEDTLTHIGKLRTASSFKNMNRSMLERRCYLVVGAFSQEDNARRLAARYESEGFETTIFRYRSGLNTVMVSPCDRIADVLEAYRKVKRLPFASKETWVLVNE